MALYRLHLIQNVTNAAVSVAAVGVERAAIVVVAAVETNPFICRTAENKRQPLNQLKLNTRPEVGVSSLPSRPVSHANRYFILQEGMPKTRIQSI